jgi:hypothetical protein
MFNPTNDLILILQRFQLSKKVYYTNLMIKYSYFLSVLSIFYNGEEFIRDVA